MPPKGWRGSYRDPDLRFFEKVQLDPETNCWLWQAYKNACGYGTFKSDDKMVLAHRWLWERFYGPIPEDMQLDHFLNNKEVPECSRACVNPDHLRIVTNQENTSSSPHLRESSRQTGWRYGRQLGLSCRKPENAHLPEGVTRNKKGFMSRLRFKGKQRYLGTFPTPEEAGEVYQEARAFERGFWNDVRRLECLVTKQTKF